MPAIPLSASHLAAVKPWYERLPIRIRQIVLAVVAGVMTLIVLAFVVRWYHHSQPAYVLEVLDRVDSAADVQVDEKYFSSQGKAVVLWIFERRGG